MAFPVIVYSFTAHPYYLGIFATLRTATSLRMNRVTDLVGQQGWAGGESSRESSGILALHR